jgi:DNA-binding MurR/RpiR family transcriptional regulator
VAQFLLTAGPRAAAMSARQIAAAAGTSDATVVRAAKSLGYESLRHLRVAVADEGTEVDLPTRLRATLADGVAGHDLLRGAVERQVHELETLLQRVSPSEFERAARVLARARRVWWCGLGPSAHLAAYAAFLSNRTGLQSGAMTHAGPAHADELLAVRRNDAVVVLAYGRIHAHVRVLLDHADDSGAKAILVTDTAASPATSAEVIRLNAGRGEPGLFASHGATIVLLEALVLAAAAHQPQTATASLNTLNELRAALAGKRVDVDP